MRLVACGVVILALGGCAQGMSDIGPPITVIPNDAGAAGLDVYGPQRAENPGLPVFRGESVVQVRTYIDPPGAGNREEAKGSCEITGGSLYTASVETPRKIVVPNYGARSPDIVALCDVDGHTASASSAVFNRTKRDIQNVGASNGLLGLFVAAMVAEAVSDENDDFEYVPIAASAEIAEE
ncbi:MAG: hypothetical protein AAGM38_01185 [Pseudomonadota bacterium]